MTLDEATKAAIEAIEAMAEVSCPPREYADALEEIFRHVETCLDAVQDDIRRDETSED